MRTLAEIHEDIDRASGRRTELWQELSEGSDPNVVDEIRRLEQKLEQLWDEHRATRARLRFGDRDNIVRRARQEERLERAA